MRSIQKMFLGLGLASLLLGGPAFATPPAAKAAAQQKIYKVVSAADQHAAAAKFRKIMSDEIEAVGEFKGKDRDTPVMHIVPTSGALIQTHAAAVDIDHEDIGGVGRKFEFRGPKAAAKFKLLVPVSAHYGLPYKSYAAGNTYEVWVEDKAGNKVSRQIVKSAGFGKAEMQITREDLVTEVEVELPFDKGDEFKVSFTPTATSKGGYTSGRELTVRRAAD